MDLYEVLGVQQSASQEDIKKAYKKKSMELHPDRGGNDNDFKDLSDAYLILSDIDKRKYYDASRKIYAKGEILIDLKSDLVTTNIKMGLGTIQIKRVS